MNCTGKKKPKEELVSDVQEKVITKDSVVIYKTKKNENFDHEFLNDECKSSKQIGSVFINFLNGSIDNVLKVDSFKLFYAENNLIAGENCFFPRNDYEQRLLYAFTDALIDSCKNDDVSVSILFFLFKNSNSNIEYYEYYNEVIPTIAITNTKNFVLALKQEGNSDQLRILENLDYIKKMDDVEILKNNLTTISEEELRSTSLLVDSVINDIFY